MSRLRVLHVALLVVAGSSRCSVGEGGGQSPRPNIVLLLADDLGYGDLGCYGHERVSTPNIDGLAQDGLRLTRMYSQPVCTPSRAAILTGRYPARYGMIRDTSPFQYPVKYPVLLSHAEPGGIPDKERPVLSEMLASLGYRQAVIGKWHLGSGHRGKHLPLNYGFNFFYGIPDTHYDGCTQDPRFRFTDGDFFALRLKSYQRKITALAALLFTLWYMGYVGKKVLGAVVSTIVCVLAAERMYLFILGFSPESCVLLQNDTILEQPYTDDIMGLRSTKSALEFISSAATGSQPFFLFMSYLQVHLPPIVSQRFRNRSGLGLYYDSLVEMDWSVGKIVHVLKKLDVYKNTLIIFVSDNGPQLWNPLTGAGDEAHLQGSTTYSVPGTREKIQLLGGKGDVWEGGIRVPCIFVWPGVISRGIESHGVASLVDIYPTICDALHEKCPMKRFDGKSLVPRFSNAALPSQHQFLMHHCDNGGVSAVTANRYKVHFRSCREDIFDPPLLFDIDDDPGETKPLEVSKYKHIIDDVRKATRRHESSLGSPQMQFGNLARPWYFFCNNPPFCRKSIDDDPDFTDLFSE